MILAENRPLEERTKNKEIDKKKRYKQRCTTHSAWWPTNLTEKEFTGKT